MQPLHKLFLAAHLLVVAMFLLSGLGMLGLSAMELWQGVAGGLSVRERFGHALEAIGMLTVALVALELGQTILEEEVQRDVKVSGPTRVRRFLSRFLVVIVVALSIETLVAAFELLHDAPALLFHASAIAASAAMLLIAWGVFIRLNRSAEELEPEAMQDVKDEDAVVASEDAAPRPRRRKTATPRD